MAVWYVEQEQHLFIQIPVSVLFFAHSYENESLNQSTTTITTTGNNRPPTKHHPTAESAAAGPLLHTT